MGESKRKRAALRRLPELSLEEHAMDLRVRVASEFRRTGRVIHRFEAVTEKGDVFHVDAGWHNDHERAMFPNSLKDAFRRRGVQRYLFATESWRGSGKTDIRPSADPDRTEHVDIIAVERGSRLFHSAEIKRADGVIGDWTTCDEFKGWLGELLDDVDSDGGDEQPSADVTRFVSQRGEPLSADDAE